jgi:hypothetical protein
MRLPNSRLVAQLAARTVTGFYCDKGYLIKEVPTGAYDEHNVATVDTVEIPVNCSFGGVPTRSDIEVWKNYADITGETAELRFAGPRPTKGDKFRITTRFDGSVPREETFEIIAIRDRFSFGFLCLLKDTRV